MGTIPQPTHAHKQASGSGRYARVQNLLPSFGGTGGGRAQTLESCTRGRQAWCRPWPPGAIPASASNPPRTQPSAAMPRRRTHTSRQWTGFASTGKTRSAVVRLLETSRVPARGESYRKPPAVQEIVGMGIARNTVCSASDEGLECRAASDRVRFVARLRGGPSSSEGGLRWPR